MSAMPVLDIEIVGEVDLPADPAGLAAVAAQALDATPAGTWVRLRYLEAAQYGEGDGGPPAGVTPVFVSVMKAELPGTDRLAEMARELTEVVAATLGRSPENVHVCFDPPARGRVAFGGRLVD